MNKSARAFCCALLLVLLLASNPGFSIEPVAAGLLETGFFKALTTPEEFRNSGIFNLLGYNALEINQISSITPRPGRIEVNTGKETAPGEYDRITVVCHNVRYYNLTIERATFEFPECRIDVAELNAGRIRFLSGSQIKLKTEVSQQDILKVFDLFARARSLSHLRLSLDKDKANLKGRVKRGILVVEFNLNGETQLADPKTVLFKCNRLVLNGSPMPRNAVNAIFSQINPVFDASKTWLNLNISSIRITRGFVETIATIDAKKG